MNTKTMRLPPRRVSMPSNKRKERDDFDLKRLISPLTKLPKPALPLAGSDKATKPVLSNQLLAGYLAHEYLTRGTLFGQTWDPARPPPTASESSRGIGEDVDLNERSVAEKVEQKPEPREEKRRRYVEVASLLKKDGAHIPGIVNPSQLARFLHM
ncbi:methylesterase 17-like [Hibiscus syriacus]|uniref:Methylesterase 17-like n=2 Tax=Hibiscus syriacus TaxID=106335 RepID=A0A6A2YAM8_HIBSY|nr:methylesterase 17-like [Hibiscus syriacus]